MRNFLIAAIAFLCLLASTLLAQVTAPFPSAPYPVKSHTWPYPAEKYPPVEYSPGIHQCPNGSGEYNGYISGGPAMYIEADPNTFWLSGPDQSTGMREVNDVSQLGLTSPCVQRRHTKAFVGKTGVQVSNRRPEFSIQSLDTEVMGTTFGITRLQVSNDLREYPKHFTSVAIKAWHPQWCYQGNFRKPCEPTLLNLQPEQTLESGEYVIWMSRGKAAPYEIWEFAIR